MSARLTDHFGVSVIGTGDAFRKNIREKTPIGEQVAAIIEKGQLVPNGLTVSVVNSYLEEVKSAAGDNDLRYLLDGFPRNIEQAMLLDPSTVDLVLHIDVPDEVIAERMVNRRVHEPSGRVYHLTWNPPKVEGKDDETGEPIVQRKDDTPEVVGERLKLYHDATAPVVEYYRGLNKCETFTGEATNEIYPRLYSYVRGWLRGQLK